MEKNEVEEGTLIVGRKDLTAAAQNLPAAEINRTHLPLTKEISQAERIVFKEDDFEAVIKKPPEKQEVPAPDENENPAGGFYDKVSESVDVKRSITTHRCGEGMDETVEVAVFDEPGNGGACHKYGVGVMNARCQMDGILISFQNGPIEEAGPNGISCEALLAIVKDRLECFQAGSFACEANGHALDAVDGALHALHSRTLGRRAAGTEGTSDPAPVETEPASIPVIRLCDNPDKLDDPKDWIAEIQNNPNGSADFKVHLNGQETEGWLSAASEEDAREQIKVALAEAGFEMEPTDS